MSSGPRPRHLIAPSHSSLGEPKELARKPQAWVPDSIKRFNNLADRARVGEGRVLPRPPREERELSNVGPGMHNVPMHSELLQRCPAFAGTSRSVPHSGFNATKRPLSQPSMEFADTPASYDLQGRFGSSFAMLAQQRPASPPGLTFGHRSVPSSSKSGAKSAGGGTSKTGGLSDSGNMRQPRPGSPGTFDPVSGLPNSSAFLSVARGGPQALRTDIGSATRAASKGAQGGGQIYIYTRGRPLRPNGDGDPHTLGPIRHMSPNRENRRGGQVHMPLSSSMSHGMSFGATSGPPHSPVGSGLMPHRPRTADHEADDRQRATQSFHAALNSVVSALASSSQVSSKNGQQDETARGSHASGGGAGGREASPEAEVVDNGASSNVWAQPGSTHGAWGGSRSLAVTTTLSQQQRQPPSQPGGGKPRREPFGRTHTPANATVASQKQRSGGGKAIEVPASKSGGAIDSGRTTRAATASSVTRQRRGGGGSFEGENMLPLGSSMRSKEAQVAAQKALAAGGSASTVIGAARAAEAGALRFEHEIASVRTLPRDNQRNGFFQ